MTLKIFSEAQDREIQSKRSAWYENEARLHGHASVNALLKANEKALVNNNPTDVSTLPRDVWGQWDQDAIEIMREELTVYNDLQPLSVSMPVGKTVDFFRRISEQEAEVVGSFDGRARATVDISQTDYISTPVPFYTNAWGFGWAEYQAGVSEGFTDIDTQGRKQAMRKFGEKLQSVILNGDPAMVHSGQVVNGLTTFPQRKTVSKGVTNLNGANGPQWKAEIAKIIAKFEEQEIMSDVTLYVNFDDWRYASTTAYDGDSALASSPATGISRIDRASIASIIQTYPQVGNVVVAKHRDGRGIPANTIIALKKDASTLGLLTRMPLTMIPVMRTHPHDEFKFEFWGSVSPQLRYSMPTGGAGTEQVGLVHYS